MVTPAHHCEPLLTGGDDNEPPGTHVQPLEPLLAGWTVCVLTAINGQETTGNTRVNQPNGQPQPQRRRTTPTLGTTDNTDNANDNNNVDNTNDKTLEHNVTPMLPMPTHRNCPSLARNARRRVQLFYLFLSTHVHASSLTSHCSWGGFVCHFIFSFACLILVLFYFCSKYVVGPDQVRTGQDRSSVWDWL
jgi:hypothetical protein